MNFNQFLTFRALRMKATVENDAFNADFTEAAFASVPDAQIKTVCAPISIPLFERMNRTLSLLDISKRQFIEAAIIEALNHADRVIESVDIFESVPSESNKSEAEGRSA